MLNIEFSTALFAIVNFILLAAALYRFLYKPVLAMLDQRRAAIDQALDEAAATHRAAAEADQRLQERIAAAQLKADGIMGQAKSQAEQAAAAILEQARQRAEAQLAAADLNIEAERNRALAELSTQIADLAIDAAQGALAGNLTPEQRQALLDDCLRDAERPL